MGEIIDPEAAIVYCQRDNIVYAPPHGPDSADPRTPEEIQAVAAARLQDRSPGNVLAPVGDRWWRPGDEEHLVPWEQYLADEHFGPEPTDVGLPTKVS